MGILKTILGRTRFYQALSHAYDDFALQQSTAYSPSDFAHLGENTTIQKNVTITHPGRVVLGDWTTIQNPTFINSMGGLHVGNYVGIGFRCAILTFNHTYRNAKTIPFDQGVQLKPVIIRDFVWVGWCSCIMPGVEIGEGAIVSMGSVVSKNVPPLAIVMGNPARVIGFRSAEHFQECKETGRTNPHRILEIYGGFEEQIPVMTKNRFPKELREMGLVKDED